VFIRWDSSIFRVTQRVVSENSGVVADSFRQAIDDVLAVIIDTVVVAGGSLMVRPVRRSRASIEIGRGVPLNLILGNAISSVRLGVLPVECQGVGSLASQVNLGRFSGLLHGWS